MNDYTLKQSTIPDKSYNSKVLIGNWFEEKCDKSNPHHYFYKEQKFAKNKYDMTSLSKENFNTCAKNWLNFQNNDSNHFVTTNMSEYKKPEDQKRNSVLKKFITKKDCFEKNPQMVEEYRKKWTQSNHVFERTYLGTDAKK